MDEQNKNRSFSLCNWRKTNLMLLTILRARLDSFKMSLRRNPSKPSWSSPFWGSPDEKNCKKIRRQFNQIYSGPRQFSQQIRLSLTYCLNEEDKFLRLSFTSCNRWLSLTCYLNEEEKFLWLSFTSCDRRRSGIIFKCVADMKDLVVTNVHLYACKSDTELDKTTIILELI